jgi:hypothetical protein
MQYLEWIATAPAEARNDGWIATAPAEPRNDGWIATAPAEPRNDSYMWIGFPVTAIAASLSASLCVGWAWQV